jgi:hypothetical protein
MTEAAIIVCALDDDASRREALPSLISSISDADILDQYL